MSEWWFNAVSATEAIFTAINHSSAVGTRTLQDPTTKSKTLRGAGGTEGWVGGIRYNF